MGEYVIKGEKIGRLWVNVVYDTSPEDPRDWDNLGTLLTWSHRYRSPDTNPFNTPAEFERVIGDSPDYVVLPVYKYEHGAVAYSTRSFIGRAHHAEWDSGQVGYIYASKKTIREWFGWKTLTQERRERVELALHNEVEDFSNYANGNVYGYMVVNEDGEIVKSCWGYYDVDECLNDGIREAKGVRNGNN